MRLAGLGTCVILLALSAQPAQGWTRERHLPLHDGRVHLNDLTDSWIRALRIDRLCDPEKLDASISLRGLGGSLWVQAMNAAIGQGCSLSVTDDELVLSIETADLPDTMPEAKTALRTFTAVAAPEATAAQQRYYGLLLPDGFDDTRPLVLLIHGLDCNRTKWTPMAEALSAEGHQVGYFTYPSDQPLLASAGMLADHIAGLRQAHPDLSVHLVAHSMGCLVARQYVEADTYAGGVDRLIMIAPPNHGSDWAVLRAALEVDEHFGLWRSEPEWSWTWAITDGLGEAGADLDPESEFVQQLNARPRRDGVRYTILAGTYHPVTGVIGAMLSRSSELVPGVAQDWWGLRQTHDKLGDWGVRVSTRACSSDGPVTLASAALEGVDDIVILPGDHTTLFIPADEGLIPPAWPVVLDRLARDAQPQLLRTAAR
jgi:pimeloyl-ACP methyl ester carboxylesterase